MNEIVTKDGEVIEANQALDTLDSGLASALQKAEIDSLVATARAYPRMVSVTQKRMTDLATIDEAAANEAVYSLPRSGKAIEGPSIRFAEMAAQSWGNCRVAARTTVIDRKEKFVEAEGVFLDAETNVATLARVRRRIVDSKGRLYNDDMILITCNAAQSIARRNAILAGIPKAVWNKGYEAARHVIMGDFKTLANRRAEAIAAFQRFGITAEQIFVLLGVKGEEDITQELLIPLRGMFAGIKNGETTVEDLLRSIAGPAANHQIVSNPLSDKKTETQNVRGTSAKDAAASHIENEDGVVVKNRDGPQESPGDTPSEAKPGEGTEADVTQSEKAPASVPTDDEAIKQAHQAGRKAAQEGKSTRAMPQALKEGGRLPEGNAWLAGHAEATAEAEGASEQ